VGRLGGAAGRGLTRALALGAPLLLADLVVGLESDARLAGAR